MYNDYYRRGYNDASRAYGESRRYEQQLKERQEALERFKKNMAELNWEAMGSERLRLYKEQHYGVAGRRSILYKIQVILIVLVIVIILCLKFL